MRRPSSNSSFLKKGQLFFAVFAVVASAGFGWPAIASPLYQVLADHDLLAQSDMVQLINQANSSETALEALSDGDTVRVRGELLADTSATGSEDDARALMSETSRGGQRTPSDAPMATLLMPAAPDSGIKVADAAVVSPQSTTTKGIVVLDPGHGGSDAGANRVFPDGFYMRESDLTLKVAQSLADLLRDEGYQVLLTRQSDVSGNYPPRDHTGDGRISVGDDLQARVDVANNANADLFVSIHFNAADTQQGGSEVFYCADRPFSDKSKKMAEFLQDDLLKAIQTVGYNSSNRGVKRDVQSGAGTYLYVLGPKTSIIYKPIAMPSVLGEALFITNDKEGSVLRNEKTLSAIASGYQKAIDQYFDWLKK